MKRSKLLGWTFMALASITSCSEDTDVLTQKSEIKLTSEITPSRVTSLDYQSTQIVEGQQVGVTIAGAKTDDHNNVAWSVGENGALTNTGDKVYYGAGDATITAYHPFNSEWTGTSHSFSVSTDQSSEANYRNSDLLWVTTTSSKTETAVPLEFAHKLAKINVTLVPEEDTMDLGGATISICNTKISTTFNPTNGAISEASGDPQEIKASVTTADAKTASAIVVPQTVNSGSQFIKIALGEKIFYYTLSAGKELKSGYSHNYTLTVKEQKVEVKGESEIKDWTDEEEATGDAEEVDFSWFNPSQYISYVENYESFYPNEDDWYQYGSRISNPIGNFSKIEFKYKMNDFSNDVVYLCCSNLSRDNVRSISLSSNGLSFDRDELDRDDNDKYSDYSYTWNELNVGKTDCMTLTISFKDEYIQLNGEGLEYKMTDYTNFSSSYFFTYYYSENDEGLYRRIQGGVPEGSKLYYVKMWDENDNLVYLGAAFKAQNPQTGQEEYCWRSYYNGENHYEYAYYPETHSNYQPYGGGID